VRESRAVSGPELPHPLPPDELAIVRAACRRYSPERLARSLGLSRHGLLSAAAGLDLSAELAARIRQNLPELAVRMAEARPEAS
jgi:hypothetical protein